jgi:hypothetical protein
MIGIRKFFAQRPRLSRFASVSGLLLGIVGWAPGGHAQQFGTDDANLTTYRACQIEAWRGETEARIEPACHLIRNLEVMLGIGLDPDHGGGIEQYTLELKTQFREPQPGGLGFGLVAGFDFAGPGDDDHRGFEGAFAYVPATLSFGDDRFLLHGNLGWHYERNGHHHGHGHGHAHDENGHHAFTWAARGDLHLPWLQERLVVVGELFGENRISPEYQVGLRTWVVPNRLVVDVSWGGHTASGLERKGWMFGFGWTPPAFY